MLDEIKKNVLAIWKGLSPSRKSSLIASLILSLSVLGGVVYLASQPRLTLLCTNTSPTETSKIVEYLESKKITYEVSDGGHTVMVPAQQVYSIRMGLASAGISAPGEAGTGGTGFELFDKPSFGVSDFMQRANYYRALEGELARSIRQLEEVANARVLIVVPEDQLFGQVKTEAKASVMIQLQPGKSLRPEQVRAIQFLVANGVERLQPERVAVVDNAGRTLAADSPVEGDTFNGDKQQKERAELELYLQEKAQSLLDQVLGPGQSAVRISSEIDFSQVQETTERFDPKNSVIKTETINNEDNSTRNQEAAGGAGSTANTPGGGSDNKLSEQKRTNTTNQYEVSKTLENRSIGAGAIKRLTIALMINQRKPIAGGKPIPRTTQEIAGLENIVKAAVGYAQVDNRADTIQTQEIAFADVFDDTAVVPVKSTLPTSMSQWLPYVTQGCLVLFAIGILMFFRSQITGKKKTNEPDAFETLLETYERSTSAVTLNGASKNGNGHANGNGHSNGNGNGNGHPDKRGILTPEELAKLIRDNPNNTSQALKQWLRRN